MIKEKMVRKERKEGWERRREGRMTRWKQREKVTEGNRGRAKDARQEKLRKEEDVRKEVRMDERKQDQGKMKLRNETGRRKGGSRGIRRLNRWDGNKRGEDGGISRTEDGPPAGEGLLGRRIDA